MNFVSGSGAINMTSSSGSNAADVNSTTEFGFGVKYTTARNPNRQGDITVSNYSTVVYVSRTDQVRGTSSTLSFFV
ncbi:hypothetical protein [Spirosoma rigui]|uniref:hypothetical protein n=1 Tax=Spirosoma rigui TaxID=564064 RepID=UPI0009B117CC|nr:hypothetical protein [Spirosoma rigui]